MSYDLTLLRGTQLLSAAGAKFGATGRETGVFVNATVENFLDVAGTLGTGTFEAWIKTTNAASYRHILSRDNHFYLHLLNGVPCLTYGTANTTLVSAAGSIADGNWHHVAAVFEAGAGRLFVDGVRRGTSAVVGAAGTPTQGFEIGGFAATSSQDFIGYIDEVAVSTTAQYSGATYTTPTTAFSNQRAGQVAVWHLEDLLDSHGGKPGRPLSLVATPGNGQVSLSWTAPLSIGDSAITDYVVEHSPTGAGTWTTFADGTSVATTATVTGLTNGTVYDFRVSAVNTQGTGDPSTPLVTGRPVVLVASNANIVYSPYNWDVTVSRALSIYPGAYIKAEIQGTPTAITALFDVTGLAGNLPDIHYRVDQGPWTRATLAATIALTMPTNVWLKHSVEIVVRGLNLTANRWLGVANAIRFQGFNTTPTTCTTVAITKRPYRIVVFGDSVTESSWNITGNPGTGPTELDASDALQGYAYRLGEQLGAEVGVVGTASQGFLFGGVGGVPTFPLAWPYIYSGVARDLTTLPPDLIVINQGTNDGSGDLTSVGAAVLNALLAATPAATKIAFLRPVNAPNSGNAYLTIAAAIAACNDPGRVKHIDTTGFTANADSSDNIHPFGYSHVFQIAPKLAAVLKPLLPGVARGAFTWAA